MKQRQGFSLLEILLAMSILSVMGIMVFGTLRSLVDATTRAEEALDSLHLSETVLNQLSESLRSAAYYDSDPRRYTFLYEKGTGSPPNDRFSWVTHSTAFLPSTFPTREGLNRIEISIEDIDGETGLAVRAFSSLLDLESPEADDVTPWMVTTRVKGLELKIYDLNRNEWVEDWERDNQLPVTLSLTLYVQPKDPQAALQSHTRRIDIPVGKVSRETRRGRRRTQEQEQAP
jgi:prepilin-type N-terminal cleavage/methylation domain-containing protein